MERFIPDDIINEIRSRCDIVDIIQAYIPLKRSGGRFRALCPFHGEKTPSFFVNQDRQSYHCFGCQKGGDVFRFVMDKEGVDFPNAAHILASRCGVVIPEKQHGAGHGGKSSDETGRQREKLYKIHEELASWYSGLLNERPNSRVAEYVRMRGIPGESLSKFRLGSAPDSWDEALKLLGGKGYSTEDIVLAGIAVRNEENSRIYDRFRNRLVFPIWDEQGRVVGFSARTVEKESEGAKYVNSPETPIFKKSRILYALHLAREAIREKGYAILCEGQLDVIAMHSAGFNNAVAPQGTAFTEEQGRILRRYAEKAFLCFDADEAGMKASLRVLEILLPLGFEVRIISFPSGKDPDEYLKTSGPGALKLSVEAAVSFFDHVLNKAVREFDQTSPFGKNKIVSEVLYYISKIESSVVRSTYASELAESMKLSENIVFSELNKKLDKPSYQFRQDAEPVQPVQEEQDSGLVKAEETLLELCIGHGDIGRRLSEELPSEMISRTPVGRALDTVISLTVNGEWENSVRALLNQVCDDPSPTLSRILAGDGKENFTSENIKKAVNDCLFVIKKHFLESEMNVLLKDIAGCQDDDEKNRLRAVCIEKRKKLIEFEKIRRASGNS
ncbi:MAG TPA: DNA primase [Lentisphaeria bacterium]|nr:MAG: DNA primase [Lentisphaerae bacterium GWF2_50_93]HCE44833.1 DNA primase [Lentisphaeria bacterium]